jgi:sugar lactone lactonase YvrE
MTTIEPFFIRSLSLVFGAFAASPWSGTARRVSTIRTAVATGCRSGLLLVAVLLGLCAAGARAQTASFSYAMATLGGGYSYPSGVAVDGSGNVYVADADNNAVKEMPARCDSSSCVTNLGGGFSSPAGVAVDGVGNVYVADLGNSAVKEMPAGCASSSCVTKLGGGFSSPTGVAAGGFGNVYVADTNNSAVKEIPAGCVSSSCVTKLGGGFNSPYGVAVDSSGNVYVADTFNNAVKEMPAGCHSSSCVATLPGDISMPEGVAVDSSGNVFTGGNYNHILSVIEIPAGCASSSCVTKLGGGFNAFLVNLAGVAVDGSGNVYIGEGDANQVNEIMTRAVNFLTVPLPITSPAVAVTFTFESAGSLSSATPYQVLTEGAKYMDFSATSAQESNVCNGTTAYNTSDTCTVNITFTPADAGARNGAVELLNAGGGTIATAYVYGTGQGAQIVFSPATQSTLGGGFNAPHGVAVDGVGNIYVADYPNNAVKHMLAGCASSSCVSTLGGGFEFPAGVALDGSGNVYVADAYNDAVKEMPAGCASSSCVSTLGGGFSYPEGVAVDARGNVYVADTSNSAVKEMPAGCASSNCVTALGGGFSGPGGVAVDGIGNVYVADYGNSAVKEMPAGCVSSSCVTTLGGGFIWPNGVAVDASGNVYVGDTFNAVYEMPAGCASSSCVTTLGGSFSSPYAVALDGSGNVYVAASGNNAVMELNRAAKPSLEFAATAVGSTSSDSPQTVIVANIGNAALTFPAPSNGNNPVISANFTINSSWESACPLVAAGFAAGTLADGAACDLPISFTPTAEGGLSGSMVLTDTNLNAPAPTYATQFIPLSGTGLGTQTITFTPPTSPVTYPVSPIALSATGGASGNPVVFSVVSGPGTVSGTNGTTLTITDAGTVVVAANQAGNTLYAAATQVTQSIVVNPPAAAILLSPTPNSQFAGSSVTFTWTPAAGVTKFWFNLGTAPSGGNAKNIYSSGSVTVLTETITGLPTNGETIYATLYSEISGVFQPTVYTFYATGPAVLTAPSPTTKLTASTTFTWTPGTGISHYWFDLGTADAGANSKNLYNTGSTTALTATVTGIPQYGETIYATLYSYISGAWQPIVYTFTASGAPVAATLTTPTPSTKLSSSSVTFTWSGGEGVTYYWFNLGTTDSGTGAKNLYSGGSTTLTSVNATGLPTNGEAIYATLYSYIAGVWQPTVYTYTASGSPTPATLTTPAPSSTLTSSTVTFTWSPGSGVTYFWLNLGTGTSGAAAKNLYSGSSTTATSVTVSGLPTNGEKIYATLYSYIGGAWQPTVYTYTAQ